MLILQVMCRTSHESSQQLLKQMLQENVVKINLYFKMYNEEKELIKICNDKIEKKKKKVMILDKDGEEHEF